jgi:hypothetical protein
MKLPSPRRSRQARPNPSLNTDVPHAGLRPASGPPVNLFRYASLGQDWDGGKGKLR